MIKSLALAATLVAGGAAPAEQLDSWITARWASAAVMRVHDGAGTWSHAAGEGHVNGHFRIGSVTKAFVATVVLQLVDEGRVALDHPVSRYVEGVPKGDVITVRQVLDHSSGLYDYAHEVGWSTNRWRGAARFRSYQPRELLDVAFSRPSNFEPGEGWKYSNTNYVVAGLLVEKVTGRPYGAEVTDRIIKPLRLRHTSVPGNRPWLPLPRARGYTAVDGRLVDATLMNPSLDWAAGEMISTTRDLGRFLDALLGGRLISPESLAAMRTTRETGSIFAYGLGLQRYDLPCGQSVWGHGGELIGYLTYAVRSDDGRTAVLSYNPLPGKMPAEAVIELFSAVYC
ncbi:D-alanyl-D-alanine carboxypeptidase [Saccharothrix tamanrassetensis]|uniref:D-alanyl-D-alanine carboxypeptidase n=1 Tax=Saccharothrix tamanrassetensis TaxID=1051531 RepID=A0A841CWB5_9PSEU|nr:serine hydrolase domain-containing protein [Saccharothrix tamanrassetensis]MBB5959666.1 D-alanyl-D-alanine carboxypeptidase [Saccharothrix tamanrassetensis]